MASLVLSDLLKTFKTAFTIAKATFDAAGLAAARTFTLPDQAGTVRLTLSTDDSVAAKLYASSHLR